MQKSVQQRAVEYALSYTIEKFVDVILEKEEYFLCSVQDPFTYKIHAVAIKKTPELMKRIAYATNDIQWRLDGNEFPNNNT